MRGDGKSTIAKKYIGMDLRISAPPPEIIFSMGLWQFIEFLNEALQASTDPITKSCVMAPSQLMAKQ
jgi:hypothetical protein